MVISRHHCSIGLFLLASYGVICLHFLHFGPANPLNIAFRRLVVITLDHSRVKVHRVHSFDGVLSQSSVSTRPFILCFSTLVRELLMNLLLGFYGHSLRLWYQHIIDNGASSKHVRVERAIEFILIDLLDSVNCYIISVIVLMGYQIHMSHLSLTRLVEPKRLKWTHGVYISVRVDLCILLERPTSRVA